MQKETVLGWVLDSLSLFGDNTKTTLLLAMQEQGVQFTPDKFNVDKFCQVIQDLLGNHAEFIIVKIVDDFCKYSQTTTDDLGLSSRASYDSPAGVIESLLKIAELAP